MKITVINEGTDIAYGIGCSIRLKSNNYIVDESSAYFGYLKENESKTEEALFIKIEDSSEYSYIEMHLYWYDEEGYYYDERR